MTLKAMFDQMNTLAISEKRMVSDEVIELVFLIQDLSVWNQQLQAMLGAPIKPTGASPSKEAKQIAQPFGGIRSDQTLYWKSLEQGGVVAMLWPWQNGENITLKVYFVKEQKA